MYKKEPLPQEKHTNEWLESVNADDYKNVYYLRMERCSVNFGMHF